MAVAAMANGGVEAMASGEGVGAEGDVGAVRVCQS